MKAERKNRKDELRLVYVQLHKEFWSAVDLTRLNELAAEMRRINQEIFEK